MGSRKCDSGRLWFDGESVCYEYDNHFTWRLPLREIRIIGEMTNPSGPFLDDYFLCFSKDSSGWLEASFYADGCDELLKSLGNRLGTQLELQLANSTDFASRVLWPEYLVGQPMFDFTDKVPSGIWQRLRNFVLPQNLQTLSKVVLRELPSAANVATEESGSEI